MYNQGACKIDIPRNIIQAIQKSNDKVTTRGNIRLNEQFPTQRRSV